MEDSLWQCEIEDYSRESENGYRALRIGSWYFRVIRRGDYGYCMEGARA